jgi:hypothetical protein
VHRTLIEDPSSKGHIVRGNPCSFSSCLKVLAWEGVNIIVLMKFQHGNTLFCDDVIPCLFSHLYFASLCSMFWHGGWVPMVMN